MLKIKNVTVQYGQQAAIRSVNLSVASGEIVGIVGESGSGKTTVLRAILGLLPPRAEVTEGEILFGETALLSQSSEQWRKLRGTVISSIFQDSGAMLNPIRRIGGQFIEYLRAHSDMDKAQAHKRAAELLTRMRLADAENVMRSYPFQLSGGMRQRVGIAMAMAFRPQLLLADEPTSALDVTIQAQIVRQMMDMHRQYNTAIVLVTHNLGVAAYMADRLIVMKEGRIEEEGSRDDVIQHPKSEYTKQLLRSVPVWEGESYV